MYPFKKKVKTPDKLVLKHFPLKLEVALTVYTDINFASKMDVVSHVIEFKDRFSGANKVRDNLMGLLCMSICFSSKEARGNGYVLEFKGKGFVDWLLSPLVKEDIQFRDHKYQQRHEDNKGSSLVCFSVKTSETFVPTASLLGFFEDGGSTKVSEKTIQAHLKIFGLKMLVYPRGSGFVTICP